MLALRFALGAVGLVLLHTVLFSVGSVFLPAELNTGEGDPRAALYLLVVAAVDTAVLGAWVRGSALRGWRGWLTLLAVFYGVRTFTSQIEAWYFMPNVGGGLVPALLAMTVPLSLLWTAALLWAWGPRGPATPPPPLPAGFAWRVLALAALVYPALFFGFGYFVALQSAAVRDFYGINELIGFGPHMIATFSADPWIYPFEALRGALWVALAWLMLRTWRGPWWTGVALVAACFALVQNSVHLLPNPLMPRDVQLYHFIETASSNALWAACIGWALRPPRSEP